MFDCKPDIDKHYITTPYTFIAFIYDNIGSTERSVQMTSTFLCFLLQFTYKHLQAARNCVKMFKAFCKCLSINISASVLSVVTRKS